MSNVKKWRLNDFLPLIIGFFFFLNPMVALFDIIPDFLGCALIMFSLHRLSPLSPDFETAFNYFKYMAIVSVARLLVSIVSGQFDSVTYLSLSLVFALTETIIAYRAVTSLCDGLYTLGRRFESTEAEPLELRNLCTVFFAVRGVCSMLPYITSVLDREDDTLLPGHIEETGDYTMLLTLVNIVITVIFAVMLAITIIKHFSVYVKSKEISLALTEALNETRINNPNFFIRKNLVFSLTLLAYSTLFLTDFIAGLPVGGRNFIPDFVFGIIAVWAVILLGRQLKGYLAPLISGAVYTVISAVSFFVYDDYLSNYYYKSLSAMIEKNLDDYITVVVLSAVETVSLIVFAVMLVRYLMPLATNLSISEYAPELIRLGKQAEKKRKASARRLIGFGIFLTVIALSGTALTALLQLFDVGYNDISFPYLLAHFVLHIAFYAYSSTVFLHIREDVKTKYDTARA